MGYGKLFHSRQCVERYETKVDHEINILIICRILEGSLQKVQGHRTAQGRSRRLGSSHSRGQWVETCQTFAFSRLTIVVMLYKYIINTGKGKGKCIYIARFL